MSEMVHITINKQPLEVPAGTRIIEAAKMLNIDIPHLCYHPDQTIKAHCRMCMVEVVGSRKLTAACSTVVWEGMEVITDSKKVYDAQTGVLDLILSDHKTLTSTRGHDGDPVPYLLYDSRKDTGLGLPYCEASGEKGPAYPAGAKVLMNKLFALDGAQSTL